MMMEEGRRFDGGTGRVGGVGGLQGVVRGLGSLGEDGTWRLLLMMWQREGY